MSKYRILWQSSTAISGFPEYKKAIETHAAKILSPDFELTVRGVKSGTSDLHFLAFDFLNNFQLFESVFAAEKEGYDAVAIGCSLDPILDELREVVDIPVLSLGEAGMLTACMLGKYFSMITYADPARLKFFNNLAGKYGLSDRTSGFTSFDLPLDDLAKGFENPEPVLEGFRNASRKAVEKGAEVIVPGCGVLNLIVANANLAQIEGAAVLDVSGALMKLTEMMVVLKEVSGTRISRKGYYEAPPKSLIAEVMGIYGVK